MSTPSIGCPVPLPARSACRLDPSLSSLPSPSPTHQLLPNMQSSLKNSTIDLLHTNAYTRARTDSYPPIRPRRIAHDRNHDNHDTRHFVHPSLSPAPTSLPASPAPGPLNQYSYSHHCLLNDHLDLPGDATPPNGVPRRWWSRGSLSPGRNSFRDLVVSTNGLDESPLRPQKSYPSSSHEVPIIPLSFSDIPSLSNEDLQNCCLASKNISNKHEDRELKESLLLSSPHHLPATPTSRTGTRKQTLKSLGIGIEEDLRNDEIEHSFWPRLLGRSPTGNLPSNPRTATLIADVSLNETILQVEEDPALSMENWDGKSVHVAGFSPVVVSLGSLSPEKGKITPSTSRATISHEVEEKAQDAFPNDRSVPTPRVHRKHSETWYNKFTFTPLRRESMNGREKEGKERWLRTREVSYCIFLP